MGHKHYTHTVLFHLHKWYLGYECPHISTYRRHLLYILSWGRGWMAAAVCSGSKAKFFHGSSIYMVLSHIPLNQSLIENFPMTLNTLLLGYFSTATPTYGRNKKCAIFFCSWSHLIRELLLVWRKKPRFLFVESQFDITLFSKCRLTHFTRLFAASQIRARSKTGHAQSTGSFEVFVRNWSFLLWNILL